MGPVSCIFSVILSAGDVKEPTHLWQRVGHGVRSVNLIAPLPLDRIVQEKCYDYEYDWRPGGLMFSALGSSPGRGTALCCWARYFTLIVLLYTQVYKWVPANLLVGVTLRWTSILSRGE